MMVLFPIPTALTANRSPLPARFAGTQQGGPRRRTAGPDPLADRMASVPCAFDPLRDQGLCLRVLAVGMVDRSSLDPCRMGGLWSAAACALRQGQRRWTKDLGLALPMASGLHAIAPGRHGLGVVLGSVRAALAAQGSRGPERFAGVHAPGTYAGDLLRRGDLASLAALQDLRVAAVYVPGQRGRMPSSGGLR